MKTNLRVGAIIFHQGKLITTRMKKDGKGDLVRCYLNRIFYPDNLKNLQYLFTPQNYKQLPNLTCTHCNNLLGTPMLYDDGRIAYRLQRQNIAKKRVF